MEPTAPGKSQPLHNFDLPRLKWNKDANSSTHHRRRRCSIKSPSRRPNTSSASPISHSPLRGSVSATPPRRKSPLQDSATPPRRKSPLRDSAALPPRESPVRGDFMMKQSPIRGKPSIPFPIQECYILDSLINGDSERLSLLREEAMRLFLRGDSPSEFEALRKSKVASIEYRRNHSRYSAFDRMRNEVCLSSIEQIKEKTQNNSKKTEVGLGGIKTSKLLIKIPFKNSNLVEENSQEGQLKIANNGEHGGTDEGQEAGKINNNVDEETKIWNLRPRKPKRKTQNVTVCAEKGNFSKMPEKNKSQSPLKNSNKSGEKERNCSSGGGEKKEKSEKKEKRKLSISIPLSKGEIEEDIFSLTGLKPARRPKKRAKNIQKQVDSVFPGLCLVSITPDSYKVPANYMKNMSAIYRIRCSQRKIVCPSNVLSGKFKVPGFHCSDGIARETRNTMPIKENEDVKLFKEDDKFIKGAATNERVYRWNLRDRKSIQSSKAVREKDKQPKMTTWKSGYGKKEKQEEKDIPKSPDFSLELKVDEISEDLFAVTGKMPSTKIKNMEKNVLKQIDLIFPGGYLEMIMADRYKVSRNNRMAK